MAPSLLRIATLGLKLISGTCLGPFEAPESGFLMKGSLNPKPYGKEDSGARACSRPKGATSITLNPKPYLNPPKVGKILAQSLY